MDLPAAGDRLCGAGSPRAALTADEIAREADFFSFGTKRRAYELDAQGIVKKKSYLDFTFVLDERICDGYYYASALRMLKNIIKNPNLIYVGQVLRIK